MILFAVVFEQSGLEPKRLDCKRRVGRPRSEWVAQVKKEAEKVAGESGELATLLLSNQGPQAVRAHICS